MLQKLLQNKNRSFTFEKKESSLKKKDRRSVFLLFVVTSLISLALWAKSGNLDLKLPSFSSPTFFSKTYVFEKEKNLPKLSADALKKKILTFLDDKEGNYGIWFKNLATDESFGIQENEEFLAASVNKAAIMMVFYQAVEDKTLKEEQAYLLKEDDKQEGTGSMQGAAAGSKYAYKELVRLMGIESDNTAAMVLLDIVGFNKIKQSLEKIGLEKTLIDKNTTTPWESGRIFELTFKGKLINKTNKEKFFKNLTNTFFEERIPAGVPEDVKVAHKIGTNKGIYNDCGIVFTETPYVLCILGNDINRQEAEKVLPEISKIVWQFISL